MSRRRTPTQGPVLAIDPSWAAFAWALCDATGPIQAGRRALTGTRRWEALCELLATLEPLRARAVRVVVEIPGTHGSTHGGRDVQTVRGVSLIAGAALGWGAAIGEPWPVEPVEWRRWMALGSGTRAELKARAIREVTRSGWAGHLSGPDDDDTADAILLGIGAARCWALGPW